MNRNRLANVKVKHFISSARHPMRCHSRSVMLMVPLVQSVKK